jgi:hypothetical protein
MASEALLLKFARHLWDPVRRGDRAVQRRLTSWPILSGWRGVLRAGAE